MFVSRWAIACMIGGGVFTAATANAYSVLSWSWAWQSGPMSDSFAVNASSFQSSAGTTAQVDLALRDAMERWGEDGGAAFAFQYGGQTTTTSFTWGDAHIAQFKNASVGGATLAIAQSWGYADEMTDCDIEFYASNGLGPINWSADPTGASFSEMDLQQVATHEFGHCAGLDHSAVRDASMYGSVASGGGPSDRLLHSDDVAGLQAAYGVATGPDLSLTLSTALRAGRTATVEVAGGDPNDQVWLIASPNGTGAGPCFSQIGGKCVDILGPVRRVGTVRANAGGVATFDFTLPSAMAGRDVGFQAVVIRGNNGLQSLISNAVVARAALP